MYTNKSPANDAAFDLSIDFTLWEIPEFKRWALRCAMTMANARPSSNEVLVPLLVKGKPVAWIAELRKMLIASDQREQARAFQVLITRIRYAIVCKA